jgi:transglutaminase-like putative cysteine protease
MRRLLMTLGFIMITTTCFATSHAGVFTMSFDLSVHTIKQETKLWIPYPVSDEHQYISNITWDGNFAESAIYTDRDNGTPMLYAHWPEGTQKRQLTFEFTAERTEQIRRDFPAQEGKLNQADFSLYLAATSLGPIDGGVKELANKITSGKRTVLAKARAIYDWTVEQMFRDPATRGCGIGDVNKLLKRPGGKCADISSVYVALARAAGVPAREIFGIRSGRNNPQDVTTWFHCWAEFFLPGYGWVPVDPADVRKAMLKQGLEIDSPEVNDLRDYFWGRVDPFRIRLGEGRDLRLNPPHQGPPLNYLMYPFAQVGKETIDWLDPETFSYQINWRPATR